VVEEDLRKGPPAKAARALMSEMIRETRRHYDDARPLYRLLDAGPAKTMKAMGRIYRGILEDIARSDGDVWTRRPGISTARKAGIVVATTLGF
jgi:phytoene/squalene synthetase